MSDKIDMRSRKSEHFGPEEGYVHNLYCRGSDIDSPDATVLVSFRAGASFAGPYETSLTSRSSVHSSSSWTCRTAFRKTWSSERCRAERLTKFRNRSQKSGQSREPKILCGSSPPEPYGIISFPYLCTTPLHTDQVFSSRPSMCNSCQTPFLLQKTPRPLSW